VWAAARRLSLDGEGLMEIEGERTVVRKDDVINTPSTTPE
jgi:mannose-6-phosphate isomerase-like protein (cupin superfamily)